MPLLALTGLSLMVPRRRVRSLPSSGRPWTVLLPTVSLSAQLSGSDYGFFLLPLQML